MQPDRRDVEAAWRSRRLGEYAAGFAIAALAFIISPPSIELATGRSDLSFRVTCASSLLVLFLLTISGAVFAWGRVRQVFFALIGCTFPLAAFAALELTSIAFRLADRIAPLEDTSIILHGDRWPGYLMSEARWQPGRRLYRPWQGPGISINALGLRTPPPLPKTPGEWRVAVTGGSAVWGWRVLDADTIPVLLQQSRRASHPNSSFFNFGIEGATLAQELALLQQFRDSYGIDQVIFYTGANDILSAYLEMAGGRKPVFDPVNGLASFELVKAATRFTQMMSEPPAAVPEKWEHEMLPRLQHVNKLRAGLMAADDYCNATRLRCDFLLQPLLFTRSRPTGSEARLARTFGRLYPGLATVAQAIYHDAAGAALSASRMHDLSDMFELTAEPVFTDNVHVNEVGNRIAAERIRAVVSYGPR
jgi:hypothetical protein